MSRNDLRFFSVLDEDVDVNLLKAKKAMVYGHKNQIVLSIQLNGKHLRIVVPEPSDVCEGRIWRDEEDDLSPVGLNLKCIDIHNIE